MPKKKFQKENEDGIFKVKMQYRKKCDLNNVSINKSIIEKFQIASETGEMRLLQLAQPVGPVVLRSIIDSFTDGQYGGLKILRLCRVSAEDQGVRVICNYINKMYSIEELNLLQNGITPLGCQFLGKCLLDPKCSLVKLKLDGNPIKTQGLKIISNGLKFNNKLQKLSLRDCQIDESGGRELQTLLVNLNSGLISLKLCRNPLKTQGFLQILKALKINDKLSKFKFCNIGVQLLSTPLGNQQQLLFDGIKQLIKQNTTLLYYDMRFNPLTEKIASQLISLVEQNQLIQQCKISQTMDLTLKVKLKSIIDSRNNKKPKTKPKKNQNKK